MRFLEYFHKNVKNIKLVDKRDSPLMKTINLLIKAGNALRITNIKDDPSTPRDESFMGGYGTTIGSTIYESPSWRWDDPPSPHMLHELTHVVQFSPGMALRYIFSSEARMYFESECVQTEMLLDKRRACAPLWFERKVEQFKKYGCDEAAIRSILRRRAVEVLDGKPLHNPKLVHNVYMEWMKKYDDPA